MEIRQHTEGYNVSLEAGEEVSITIGAVTKTWTVEAGKTGQFRCNFDEEVISE